MKKVLLCGLLVASMFTLFLVNFNSKESRTEAGNGEQELAMMINEVESNRYNQCAQGILENSAQIWYTFDQNGNRIDFRPEGEVKGKKLILQGKDRLAIPIEGEPQQIEINYELVKKDGSRFLFDPCL